ncbi:MAG TPA: hypothetical protein VGG85_07340 [Terracidiphilus sp.]
MLFATLGPIQVVVVTADGCAVSRGRSYPASLVKAPPLIGIDQIEFSELDEQLVKLALPPKPKAE